MPMAIKPAVSAGNQRGQQPRRTSLQPPDDPQHAQGDAGADDRHEAGEIAAHLVHRQPDEIREDHHRDAQQGIGAQARRSPGPGRAMATNEE